MDGNVTLAFFLRYTSNTSEKSVDDNQLHCVKHDMIHTNHTLLIPALFYTAFNALNMYAY